MGELINGRTPEEIINGLKCEVPCSKCAYREHNFMKDDSCSYYVEQDILALIAQLEAERDAALAKVPKWISVDERLPEKCGTYLTATKNGAVRMNHFYHRHSVFGYKNDATHWMPLPETQKKQTEMKEVE